MPGPSYIESSKPHHYRTLRHIESIEHIHSSAENEEKPAFKEEASMASNLSSISLSRNNLPKSYPCLAPIYTSTSISRQIDQQNKNRTIKNKIYKKNKTKDIQSPCPRVIGSFKASKSIDKKPTPQAVTAIDDLRVVYLNPSHLADDAIQEIAEVIQKYSGPTSECSLALDYLLAGTGRVRLNQAIAHHSEIQWLMQEIEKGLTGKSNKAIKDHRLLFWLQHIAYLFEARFLFPAVLFSELAPKFYKQATPAILKPPAGGLLAAGIIGLGTALEYHVKNKICTRLVKQIEDSARQQGINLSHKDQNLVKERLSEAGWCPPAYSSLLTNTWDKIIILTLLGYVNPMTTQLSIALLESAGVHENINATDLANAHLSSVNTSNMFKNVANTLNIFCRVLSGRAITVADAILSPQPWGSTAVNGLAYSSLLGGEHINDRFFSSPPEEDQAPSARLFLIQAFISAACISLTVTALKPLILRAGQYLSQVVQRAWK